MMLTLMVTPIWWAKNWISYESCEVPEVLTWEEFFSQFAMGVGVVCRRVVRYSVWRVCSIVAALFSVSVCLKYVCFKIREVDVLGRNWFSYVVDKLMLCVEQPEFDSKTLRSAFTNCVPVKVREYSNHSHGKAAAVRNAASEQIEVFCKRVGLKSYRIQMSDSDVRKGYDGCRTYFWAKDLSVAPRGFDPPRRSVLAIVVRICTLICLIC